ncbi:PBSX family phage terminase large subunit [Actinobacillus pleuropneumoniae]|uniref:Phage terminase, large subunit, PBSX family n=1 Tax=Actinobacillus pleuropneumoniae serovar 6 str. Femo TaxID=754256 RepID=A0A828PMJ6_ACTPL|nr:PBSX family phage terminase large subunit [Actinobacillus pleuropneumoniae]EFM92373.1 Phage terminase, large subunit, PBSX family [Actinobacillus pleuropneumoniae serovar 6 str. Femo]UKH13542.1 PBSX family phage terminase large subunit [Actinobacillus pleuropneumoniae serovar 6 str. Femo]UKH13545.1 PBSX family phage terminase large subunit [Actinobacillus pleuropneumoniae serovar 6 str. Femo]SUU61516.1 phage terminase, large subunit, PBSX family [Actinobacillus pleuropneumoniae]
MSKVQLTIPAKLVQVFIGEARYRGAYGGRGSAKTRTFALMTAVWALRRDQAGDSGVILCAREYMNSLEESSLEEVKQAIRSTSWLEPHFVIGEKFIKTKSGRISYVFAGLRHNLDSIKSKARILLAWVEEAETVSEVAWQKLEPTVREHNSEIWVTWNPEKRGSATDLRFRRHVPENAKIIEMNYSDNPWFPKELEQTRLADKARLDDATYRWIWEGAYLEQSEAQIFRDKYQELEFEPNPDFDGPYYGLDFGFANDPTAAIKCWVFDGDLYIEYEAGQVRLELDETASFISERIPEFEKYISRADSARPESISYLKRHGFPRIEGVKKWQGSVEDGIEHIKSYGKVYIHPRCKETLNEFRLYSYKTDRLTGDVLPQIVDANNHYIDALRYALTPLMQVKQATGILL